MRRYEHLCTFVMNGSVPLALLIHGLCNKITKLNLNHSKFECSLKFSLSASGKEVNLIALILNLVTLHFMYFWAATAWSVLSLFFIV